MDQDRELKFMKGTTTLAFKVILSIQILKEFILIFKCYLFCSIMAESLYLLIVELHKGTILVKIIIYIYFTGDEYYNYFQLPIV